MHAFKEKLVDLCIIVTVTMAMLLALELAARAAIEVRNAIFSSPNPPSTILKQAWGRQYESDEGGLVIPHVDYVEFREAPYRSATINVDKEGRRSVPGNCELADASIVWTFGGSTMFGYGAPDEFTIPAYLAKLLNREKRCARIVNFGASSWQSTQSLIQLIEVLKRGQRPHAVIFYDGVNEPESPAPGGITPAAKLRLEQAFLDRRLDEELAAHSALVRIARRFVLGPHRKHAGGDRSTNPADVAEYAKAVASLYAQNVRIVEVLAREYGFSAYYFLQPYPLISGKKLTATENAMMKAVALKTDTNLMKTVYRAIRQESALPENPRYFDISGIFDGLTEEIFADEAHLLPEGNRIVAERIAREIVLPRAAK